MSEPEHGLRVLSLCRYFHWVLYCSLHQSHFSFAQEFMSGGSLDRRIWNQPLCSVSWEEKLQWCKDTAKVWLLRLVRGTDWSIAGNGFCAPLGFAHRDLKNQNVLYDIDSGRAKVLQGVRYVCLTLSEQVADFGMTKHLEQSASHSPRTSSTNDIPPTAMMTSAFGTGKMHSTLPGLQYHDLL